MANDSFIVDSIASILASEISLDVLQLTYYLPRNDHESIRDHRTVVIMIDDGESDTRSLQVPDSCRDDGPLLLVKASLKAINLHVYQGYQLNGSPMEQVAKLVRDFSRTYLRNIDEKVLTWAT